jgi:hypothetical protein
MLTGRRLFKTDSEIKTLEKIKKVDIKPPSSLNPNIPQRLDDLVMKALTADRDTRFRDAREFQHALLEYMYPSTPPVIQRSLSIFMEELFATEKAEELVRFEAGSAIAIELYNRPPEMELSPDWEEGATNGTGTLTHAGVQQSRAPFAIAVLAILLLLSVIAAFVTERILREPAVIAEPTVEVREVEVARTTGAVVFRLNVAGQVFLDDALLGEGEKIVLTDLEPGERTFRIVAEGYVDATETVEIEAGDKAILKVNLKKERGKVTNPGVVTPVEDKTPPPPTNAPQVRFESVPAGAQVYLDNSLIGRTPMTWTKGDVGGSHAVSFRMDGYTATNFDVSVKSGQQTHSKTLNQKAAAQGTVNINLRGKGWADIYIDGKNVGRTPKFGVKLSAGVHEITAVNEQIGLNEVKSVTVVANETSKVLFGG